MAPNGKRVFHKYSEQALQDALSEIREGRISILGASVKYGVPRSTIQDRIHGRILDGPRKMGPPTILTIAEEKRLVEWCQDLAKCGFPLKIDDLLNTVQLIIKDDKRSTPFANNRPGRKWFSGFLKRHPDLALRESEGISKGRAIITEQSIRKWFLDLKDYLKEENALDILDDPSRIFNGDETSFCLCPKTGKVLAPKGYRNVYSIQRGNDKETITVLLVFSADGKTIDPMVVFPFIRMPKDIVNSLPDRWFLGKSETGWMVSETFYEYVANCVHKWLDEQNVQRPVLLFVDGHKSHMTLELSKFCENNQIILYALPPNTTHIMQPADVSVFKPLKTEWKKTVREWQTRPENDNKVLSKSTFCPLLHMVLNDINLEDTIKNGFRKCGLYPFNADNVDYSKCVKNRLEELNCENYEKSNTLVDRDYVKAIQIISLISPKLSERGINSDIVIEEITALRNSGNIQNIQVAHNATVQPGTYVINEDGVLEIEKIGTEATFNENNILDSAYLLTPTSSRNKENSSLLAKVSIPSSPTVKSTADCTSPCSSTYSAIVKNVFNPINSPLTGLTTLRKNHEASMSPSFENHLNFPRPPPCKQAKKTCKAPNAISAIAWRQHVEAKENEKIAKAEAIKERKLQRQKRKIQKESISAKPKKGKQKQLCRNCNEDLDTDAEYDDLKNVGCDNCPRWYHLKCTEFKNLKYDDIIGLDFVCQVCKDQDV